MKKNKRSTLILGLFLTSFLPINGITYAQQTVEKTTNKTSISTKVLTEILEKNRALYKDGKVADYIPELGKMDAKAIAFSVVDENGKIINVGD
ncbi:MAG: glutaminase A, partial [Bacilli bacterium]